MQKSGTDLLNQSYLCSFFVILLYICMYLFTYMERIKLAVEMS
jgi:hypothetical protein